MYTGSGDGWLIPITELLHHQPLLPGPNPRDSAEQTRKKATAGAQPEGFCRADPENPRQRKVEPPNEEGTTCLLLLGRQVDPENEDKGGEFSSNTPCQQPQCVLEYQLKELASRIESKRDSAPEEHLAPIVNKRLPKGLGNPPRMTSATSTPSESSAPPLSSTPRQQTQLGESSTTCCGIPVEGVSHKKKDTGI